MLPVCSVQRNSNAVRWHCAIGICFFNKIHLCRSSPPRLSDGKVHFFEHSLFWWFSRVYFEVVELKVVKLVSKSKWFSHPCPQLFPGSLRDPSNETPSMPGQGRDAVLHVGYIGKHSSSQSWAVLSYPFLSLWSDDDLLRKEVRGVWAASSCNNHVSSNDYPHPSNHPSLSRNAGTAGVRGG